MGSAPSRTDLLSSSNGEYSELLNNFGSFQRVSDDKNGDPVKNAAQIISAKKLAIMRKKQKEETRKKILQEFPELADSLEALKQWMKELETNREREIKDKTMSLSSKMLIEELFNLYFEHEPMEHKKILGDEIAAEKGGRIFTEYLTALSAVDGDQSPSKLNYKLECSVELRSVCWNYSDASPDFCMDIEKAGIFHLLISDLKRSIKLVNDSKIRENIILPSISIIHNCGKAAPDKKKFFAEENVLEAVVPYTKIDDPEIKMIAMLTLAYIIEEKDNQIISTDNSMIKFILGYLKRALRSPDHKCEGFSAEEIVSGLRHLANNDKNKETIVEEGILPMLVQFLQEGSDSEKAVGAKTVWVLSFSQANKKKIYDEPNMMKILGNLRKAEGPWKESACGALWVLEEESRIEQLKFMKKKAPRKALPTTSLPVKIETRRLGMESPRLKISSNMKVLKKKEEEEDDDGEETDVSSDLESKASASSRKLDRSSSNLEFEEQLDIAGEDTSNRNHVMISYQWDCQKLMIRMKDKLEKMRYRVWIDVESMGGSTLQAMAEAVENSAAVLICLSRKYKDSPNCRTEAEYAYKLGKPLIPIRVEQNYEADGWLGALQGAKLYFDFSNILLFESVFSKLQKELGARGRAAPDVVDGLPVAIRTTQPRKVEKGLAVKDWSAKEVKDWATKNEIIKSKMSSLDGDAILFLKRLKDTAPEFYYRFAHDRLGMMELKDLLNLNRALEKLPE